MNSPDLSREVLELVQRVAELNEFVETVEGLPWTLHDLALLDVATQNLRLVRDHALVSIRTHGRSWSAIGAMTGVPATTWRGRFNRHPRGESQS